MRWQVWLGGTMEMYRTANPGMAVRPHPWPRGVARYKELKSFLFILFNSLVRLYQVLFSEKYAF